LHHGKRVTTAGEQAGITQTMGNSMNNDNDNDESLHLRDKFAMEALPALIARYTAKNDSIWVDINGITESFEQSAEIIAVMAYKIADEMRKARLQSFT
jgi:hypothetical protein